MPSRRDGRIEPGQPLKSAISAAAWNRAQDAADVVLGQRPGFGAEAGAALPGSLVVPCRVTTTVAGVKPGYVVSLFRQSFNQLAFTIPSSTNPNDTRAARAECLSGQVWQPVVLANYEDAGSAQLAVIVGGTSMPTPSAPAIVHVCIAGMCVARVRPRFSSVAESSGGVGITARLRGSVKRTTQDTDEALAGAAEAATCGNHRIISYLTLDSPVRLALVLM